MESLETRKRITNLGKALVEELGLNPGVDTLARWMAHYIAEQMEIAEHATGNEKAEAEQRCFETILKLWHHRSSFPNGRRPFERFEPIFRFLERLDPENQLPYYFRNARSAEHDQSSDVTDPVQRWLDVASGIDQAVRIWLGYVLEQAAQCAVDEGEAEWLKNSVGLQDDYDTSIMFSLLDEDIFDEDEATIESDRQEQRELIISRIRRLEAFTDFNQELLSIYRQKLEDLSVHDSAVDENIINDPES